MQCVPIKEGIKMVPRENNVLVPIRLDKCSRLCMDYWKLNSYNEKDYFLFLLLIKCYIIWWVRGSIVFLLCTPDKLKYP